MSVRPQRIVDAHVHLWDPARVEWYPYLLDGRDLGMGDVAGMARRFDVHTYRREAPLWNVDKFVNVAAATGQYSIDETLELDAQAAEGGHPDAIVGGIAPTDTIAEAVLQLDRQMRSSRFRGVRTMGSFDGPLPPREILGELSRRHLVFDLLARPDQLVAAARGLREFDELVVVVEHVGWPRSADADEVASWESGLSALSEIGGNVACKLSGLAMAVGSLDADALRPWIERAIDIFGVDRCMFASNFPVDGLHGTLDELWTSYALIASALDEGSRDKLFATNAERIYRC